MDIWRVLDRAVRLHPAEVGVIDGQARLTWAEVGARAAALARFLTASGVSPGDRVALLADNGHAFLEAYFAAGGLGAILCPLNTRLAAAELAHIARDAGTGLLLADSRFGDQVLRMLAAGTPVRHVCWIGELQDGGAGIRQSVYEDALAEHAGAFEPRPAAGDAVAQLYYTSGTTGQPKGVMLTQRNVCQHALAAIAELGLSESDTWGHFAPMFHLADAWATFAVTWVGGRHVFVPRFDAAAALAAIEAEGVTATNLVPTMLNRLAHHERVATSDLSSLRIMLSGGAPIAPALVRRVVDVLGCEYAQTYGLTETSPYVTVSLLKDRMRHLPAAERLAYQAKTGRPFLSVELEVVDEHDVPVAADEHQVGEIRVRGATVSPGYWRRPDETAAAFRDGWLYTGDLAVVDGEGYLTIVDRKKDVILSGGETVYSIEVENALYRHPAVLEAAVFGVPDPQWGEAVHAAVVRHPGETATAESIVAFCRRRLAAFKAPKAVEFLQALPRTGSGKIAKRTLREGHRDASTTA